MPVDWLFAAAHGGLRRIPTLDPHYMQCVYLLAAILTQSLLLQGGREG